MIQVTGLRKRWHGRLILDGLTFALHKGEVFGLTGPLGAGKTTTLRILATLIRADEGEAIVDGIDVDVDPRAARMRFGYLAEAPGFHRRRTLREDLEFTAGIHGVPRARRRALAGELLEVVGLADQREDDVAALRTGQRRRLELARAIVHDPPVLLLDEPTAGVDEESADEVRAVVGELAGMGTTILLTASASAGLDGLCTATGALWGGRLALGARGALAPVEEPARS
ncbi:MAG: ABC transporter ATP-binding protein [Acidimicrobiales bacterium]